MELCALVAVEAPAHREKSRVRAGVRNGMSALLQDAVALVMLCI